jgi:hypothetical protein
MIFDEGGVKLVVATRIFILRSISPGHDALLDFKFGGSARCKKVSPKLRDNK